MVVTDPDDKPYRRHTMIVVPSDTPGIEIIRNVGIGGWAERTDPGAEHAHIRYNKVRVPVSNTLGNRGEAFVVAQTRLGGGRIHHAMRTVGMAQAALWRMFVLKGFGKLSAKVFKCGATKSIIQRMHAMVDAKHGKIILPAIGCKLQNLIWKSFKVIEA